MVLHLIIENVISENFTITTKFKYENRNRKISDYKDNGIIESDLPRGMCLHKDKGRERFSIEIKLTKN